MLEFRFCVEKKPFERVSIIYGGWNQAIEISASHLLASLHLWPLFPEAHLNNKKSKHWRKKQSTKTKTQDRRPENYNSIIVRKTADTSQTTCALGFVIFF